MPGASAATAVARPKVLWRRRGGALPADNTPYDTRVGLKIRGPANLVWAWSAQPVPASPRPPRAAHRPAAARAPRTTPRTDTLSATPTECLAFAPPPPASCSTSSVPSFASSETCSNYFLVARAVDSLAGSHHLHRLQDDRGSADAGRGCTEPRLCAGPVQSSNRSPKGLSGAHGYRTQPVVSRR